MAKFVQLGTSQDQRWQLPDDYDIEVLRQVLEGCLEKGTSAFIPVLIDGVEMELRLDGKKLEAYGVVELPESSNEVLDKLSGVTNEAREKLAGFMPRRK